MTRREGERAQRILPVTADQLSHRGLGLARQSWDRDPGRRARCRRGDKRREQRLAEHAFKRRISEQRRGGARHGAGRDTLLDGRPNRVVMAETLLRGLEISRA